ncbi:MAG: creatininase family protein, partial [Gemmatimonadaceae bacterium]
LPWGATEAHNTHLPYATDTIQGVWVSEECARRAWERGARVVVLPAIPFGVQTGQRDIEFCINMNPSTQLMVLRDIVRSLETHRVRKLVVLNGHGGNDFRQMIRELQPETALFLCVVNWYSCVSPAGYFDESGDHAGEMETSVMLHVAPSLVSPLDEAGAGKAKRSKVAGIREGWAWAPRAWTQVTEDTGVGDPHRATAEKGQRFLEAVSERLAGFLVDLAAADPASMYE